MFGIDHTRPIPDAERVCPFELTLILDTIQEFQEELHRLIWFSRVNMDAVDRIIQKLERRGHAENPVHRRTVDDWRRQQTERVTEASRSYHDLVTMIQSTENALSADSRRTKGKSLYLQRVLNPDPWSKQFTKQIYRTIQKGDFLFVVEAIASKSSMPIVSEQQLQSLAGDLFRYAVMFWPEQAKAFLFLEPSPEQFLIDYRVLKWGIYTMGARKRRPRGPRRDHSPVQTQHFRDLLDACTERRSEVLLAKDEFGRLPAHYAAMYDLSWARGDLSDSDCSWLFLLPALDALDTTEDEDLTTPGARFKDIDGLTPLDIAVMHDYTSLRQLETLADLDRHLPRFVLEEVAGRNMPNALMDDGSAFCCKTLAYRLGGVAGLRRSGCVGEFVRAAAQVGCMDAVGYLLRDDVPPDQESRRVLAKSEDNGWADSRGWTPLFHACAQGHYDVVKHLLSIEGLASHTRTDHLGWTAKEYAVLNGHLAVAALFEPSSVCGMKNGPGRMPADKITIPTVHCPEGERIIIASLGSERLNEGVTGVDLFYCSSDHKPTNLEGLACALEVSAPGTGEGPHVVRMPILDDQINCPFVFSVPAGVELKLMFRIIDGVGKAENEKFLSGTGMALLEGNTRQFGPSRQSLIREQTIPIIDHRGKETCDGTVTFTYMVVNHFPHLQTPREVDLVRKPTEPPFLVGHRGLGMNLKTHEYLQIGENTVESFLSAAKLGASFVEFDVQVTKDHEAVIFHDFSLSESGTDVPIHDLTLDQFMYASNIQSPHGNPLSVLGPTHSRDEPDRKRGRSRSVGGHFEAGAIQVRDRMKHTVDFKLKGYKPNTRGDFVQDSFATLKELLAQVPEDVGFDIEIKYPRLHEATAANVAPVAIDLNTFVDTALLALHEHATPNRRIMLSSFTPEICILLSIKQKAFPVFFITNAGKVPMIDMERRAASVQVAVRFARRWNLAGVVFACEPMLLCPRLVGYVKNRGLVCATYGELNNVPENVRIQSEAGVDIIIADRVGLVAKTLAEEGVSPGEVMN
ncbi:Glycerophosphoryl diester phosphodiesterase family-domain-containing protein [Coniochaeta sp. 2T2.1]|nr:Glycerophosphoryl diester phosphodiesterase family-domain-containing protein [Coniochaeta sp. 2T2.1]